VIRLVVLMAVVMFSVGAESAPRVDKDAPKTSFVRSNTIKIYVPVCNRCMSAISFPGLKRPPACREYAGNSARRAYRDGLTFTLSFLGPKMAVKKACHYLPHLSVLRNFRVNYGLGKRTVPCALPNVQGRIDT
jgi:hypothetical protein